MILSPGDIQALLITLQLAAVTTLLLLVFGTPLAWWLARTRSRLSFLLEAIVALPLVLPPTVLGFYLLLFLGPQGPAGWLGLRTFAFSFTGLVIGSLVYSLPFVVQPLQNSFAAIDESALEAAATLGASPIDRFLSIALPLSKPGFITATALGFAHTVGEFGVVLMIGGSIPGETRVASIAIFDHVEGLNYSDAHVLAAVLLAFSFAILAIVYATRKGGRLL